LLGKSEEITWEKKGVGGIIIIKWVLEKEDVEDIHVF
jgi:hypothetical protein